MDQDDDGPNFNAAYGGGAPWNPAHRATTPMISQHPTWLSQQANDDDDDLPKPPRASLQAPDSYFPNKSMRGVQEYDALGAKEPTSDDDFFDRYGVSYQAQGPVHEIRLQAPDVATPGWSNKSVEREEPNEQAYAPARSQAPVAEQSEGTTDGLIEGHPDTSVRVENDPLNGNEGEEEDEQGALTNDPEPEHRQPDLESAPPVPEVDHMQADMQELDEAYEFQGRQSTFDEAMNEDGNVPLVSRTGTGNIDWNNTDDTLDARDDEPLQETAVTGFPVDAEVTDTPDQSDARRDFRLSGVDWGNAGDDFNLGGKAFEVQHALPEESEHD
ncbi:hypothetical protein LTS18_012009, partial [Coniosporium uncinatum]